MTTPCGMHVTPEAKISFYLDSEKLLAEVEGIEEPFSVGLSAAKVEQLLHNSLLVPVFDAESNEVFFEPALPKKKNWEKKGELSLPPGEIHWISHSDGKISYAFANSVTTWDWRSDREQIISYATEPITALAEKEDGSLILGNKEGKLFFSGGLIDTGINAPIEGIYPFGESCASLKLKFCAIVFDLASKKILKRVNKRNEMILCEEGIIISLEGSIVKRYLPDSPKGEILINDVSRIRCLRESRILAFHTDNKTISSWDVREKKQITTFTREVFPNDMILLSDNTLMCILERAPARIEIQTLEGERLFSLGEFTQIRREELIQELADGSVAIKFPNSLLILKPSLGKPKQRGCKAPQFKKKIRNNPYRLDLYNKLAARYIEKEDKQYRVYLSGLLAAIKLSNLYQARRFYEKARKKDPKAKESYEIFLSFLRGTDTKLYRRVLLDQNSEALSELREKNCTKRLFIGEGNFGFTEALLKKHEDTHPHLAKSIVATELERPDGEIMERVARLMELGVKIFFGIDGREIDRKFKGERFKRIHWNHPFGYADSQSRRNFQQIIPQFFLSASKLQLEGDRIHIALMQEKSAYWIRRQQENPIVLGGASAGYRLIRRRSFGEERYPGYKHMKTGGGDYPHEGESKEFIFEKTGRHPSSPTMYEALSLKDPQKKEYTLSTERGRMLEDHVCSSDYYVCSSDDDSSDYYTDEEE